MSLRSLDRLLLVPALLVLGSLMIAGCAASPDTSTSPSRDDRDAAEETEPEVAEETGGCPADFSGELIGITDFRLLAVEDFAYPEVGTELLEQGCRFALAAEATEVDGASGEVQVAYVPGSAADIPVIGATLEAAGYTAVSPGIYSKPTGEKVAVEDSSLLFTPEVVDSFGLGLGDTFVVITGLTVAV